MKLFAIALRNLLRARRRSLIMGGTMALGTAALVLGGGLADGIERQLTSNLVATQTGHLQVVARALDFHRWNSPFDAYGWSRLPGALALARRIEAEGKDHGVVRATPYLHGQCTAMSGSRSTQGTLLGIVPGNEPDLERALAPESGTFLRTGGEPQAYIAAPAARKLRLAPGDTVSFVVQTPEGTINSLDVTVAGVFRKGAPWHDMTFYVPLEAAQKLYSWEGDATNIKVTLANGGLAAARRARPWLESLVGMPQGMARDQRAVVETYEEAGRFSFSIIEANRASVAMLSSFLFLAAAVGVVNGMLMSVHERTREIGTVRALGMRRSLVVRLFLYEGLALGLLAAAAGLVLGGSYVLWLGARGIPMNTVTLSWIAGGDHLFPALTAASALRAGLTIALLSTLAAIYPALAASRMEPREALHHV